MGQSMPCACFEHMSLMDAGSDEKILNERLKMLIDGVKVKRKAYLGLASQDLFINLSEDQAALRWKTENTWTAAENGEIDLTSQVKTFRTTGDSSAQVIGLDDKTNFEFKFEDATVRDKWTIAINELLQKWIDDPTQKPRSSVKASGTSNKAEYFRLREEEIKAREKVNNERKAKYAAGGMNFTAQIMADRS